MSALHRANCDENIRTHLQPLPGTELLLHDEWQRGRCPFRGGCFRLCHTLFYQQYLEWTEERAWTHHLDQMREEPVIKELSISSWVFLMTA